MHSKDQCPQGFSGDEPSKGDKPSTPPTLTPSLSLLAVQICYDCGESLTFFFFFASYLYSCLEVAITGAWGNKNLFQRYCGKKMEKNSLSWEFSVQCKLGMKVHYTPSALDRWGVLMPPCKTSNKKMPRNTLVHPHLKQKIHPALDSGSALHSWQQLEAQALLCQLLI